MQHETISVRHYGPGGRENGGGIGRLIGYLVDEAKRNGVDHSVRDTRGPDWSPPESVIRMGQALLGLTRDAIFARHRVHHIHMAGRGSTLRKLVVAGCARAYRCHYLLHLHDYDYREDFDARPKWQKQRIRAMVKGADHVIVLGQRDRRTMIEDLRADPSRVSIIHNCVPDPGPRIRAPEPTVRILFLGRLSERKGVTDLLNALALPAMVALSWRAVVAGDGPVGHYRSVAEQLGIADRVEMPGWLDTRQTHDLCRRSDILVLPSFAEGLAMAVLEGLAHGLAVVTTRVGAHEEAIVDGMNGRFVPAGDAEALAATLASLVADPLLREELGRNGRETFLTRFDIAAYSRRLDALYATLPRSRDRKRIPGIRAQ